MYYKKSEYKFIQFQKSDRAGKKYTAVLQAKPAGKIVYIHFGAIKPDGTPYEQYKDSTGLKFYSKYDHGDKQRQKKYKARQKGVIKTGYYSPSFFSMRYLW
jgi:hypothetical protein